MELDRLVPKSIWVRKRSKTGFIQKKTRKENFSYQISMLINILEFKSCGLSVHMCSLVHNFISRTGGTMGLPRWECGAMGAVHLAVRRIF